MGSGLISSSAPWTMFESKGMMLKAMFPGGLSCGGRVVLWGDPRTPSHSLKHRDAHQNESSGGLASLGWGAGWGGCSHAVSPRRRVCRGPLGWPAASEHRPLGAPRSGEGEAWRRSWDPGSQGEREASVSMALLSVCLNFAAWQMRPWSSGNVVNWMAPTGKSSGEGHFFLLTKSI